MPLTPLQRLVVGTLRPFRSSNSYVGGGAALNQRWPRLSDDMEAGYVAASDSRRDGQAVGF